jgi:exopolyphosphatase/guanosine-5'-triphosphate,3'-diphosphate pyrophosphatase
MRVLAVDIGTNSVRYLLCDIDSRTRLSVLDRGGKITRLGQDLHETGLLKLDAIQRTANAVAEIIEHTKPLSPEKTLLASTSAARDAKNIRDFIDRMCERTGVLPVVLSGVEEAEAVYSGVTHEMPDVRERATIIDIGGGSTECIYHDGNGRLIFKSVDVGAVRMTDRFIRNDPPHPNELTETQSFVIPQFHSAIQPEHLSNLKCIGVGGTITTLPAILLGMRKYDHDKIHGYYLARQNVQDILERLSMIGLEDRKRVPGLEPERADIIIAGIVILNAFLDFAGFKGLRVSDRGILFGLALNATGT